MVLTQLLLSTSFFFLSIQSTIDGASSYECGFEPLSVNHIPFCMKFFLLAIIFIVFDVEVAFLVPALYSSSIVFSFTIILLLGLVYEFAYGGLSWVY
jgi:NADH:ubiquinone oxidoreductase subunit 3 (subunit A)